MRALDEPLKAEPAASFGKVQHLVSVPPRIGKRNIVRPHPALGIHAVAAKFEILAAPRVLASGRGIGAVDQHDDP